MLAYHYATVPCLADARGLQPVVKVDMHEEPYAVPLASNVDRFFDTYSRYLEVLVAEPDYEELGPPPFVPSPGKCPSSLPGTSHWWNCSRPGASTS
ncbi:MAG TPA: hypothetical protein VK458_01845 [Myxococcaceae bacterium]|nr:hypothetical protein [Myxococcaceae bacterium]